MQRCLSKASPKIHASAFVHESAEVIGRVTVGKNASIWPMAVLRGDIEPITIGEDVNIQDSTVLHTSKGLPVTLEKGVTVGHAAIIHGARVCPYALIGMGAILLDGSEVGEECLIGAGAVIPEGMHVPPRSLVLGIPGKVIRPLRTEEIEELHRRSKEYIDFAVQHRKGSHPLARKPVARA